MIIVGNDVFSQQSPLSYHHLSANKSANTGSGIKTPTQQITNMLPANYYCTQLGFFCKSEWKFETATKIPFKFRLGSLSYNDWMEGKKNAGILPESKY